MPRHLVVGDVHGCLGELTGLLDLVADPERALVFVGDLVAKGPDSRGVLALARERGARAVLGNHDKHALRWLDAQEAGAEPPGRSAAHSAMCASFGRADWDYLRALPCYLRLEHVEAIVVHAGLVPGVALEQQEEECMISMRTLRSDGRPSKRLGDGVPWASLWRGPELVVFGHDAVTGLQRHRHAIGLDTGCVYGGRLTGLLLPEREVVSVPALGRHSEPEG